MMTSRIEWTCASRRIGWLLGGLLILGAASPAAAQNLLTNPGFTSDESGWLPGGGGQFDGTRDADGSPTSGSSRRTATNLPASFGTFGRQQCVTGITAGAQYQFGGAILVSQGTSGAAGRYSVLWTSNTACNAFLPTSFGPNVTAQGTWTPTTTTATAPATAVAALISLDIIGGTTPGDIAVNFDNVFFQEVPPVPTFTGRWLGTLALGLVGVGALGLLRRNRFAS